MIEPLPKTRGNAGIGIIEKSLGFKWPRGISRHGGRMNYPVIKELNQKIKDIVRQYATFSHAELLRSTALEDEAKVAFLELGPRLWPISANSGFERTEWLADAAVDNLDGHYPKDLYYFSEDPEDRERLKKLFCQMMLAKCIQYTRNHPGWKPLPGTLTTALKDDVASPDQNSGKHNDDDDDYYHTFSDFNEDETVELDDPRDITFNPHHPGQASSSRTTPRRKRVSSVRSGHPTDPTDANQDEGHPHSARSSPCAFVNPSDLARHPTLPSPRSPRDAGKKRCISTGADASAKRLRQDYELSQLVDAGQSDGASCLPTPSFTAVNNPSLTNTTTPAGLPAGGSTGENLANTSLLSERQEREKRSDVDLFELARSLLGDYYQAPSVQEFLQYCEKYQQSMLKNGSRLRMMACSLEECEEARTNIARLLTELENRVARAQMTDAGIESGVASDAPDRGHPATVEAEKPQVKSTFNTNDQTQRGPEVLNLSGEISLDAPQQKQQDTRESVSKNHSQIENDKHDDQAPAITIPATASSSVRGPFNTNRRDFGVVTDSTPILSEGGATATGHRTLESFSHQYQHNFRVTSSMSKPPLKDDVSAIEQAKSTPKIPVLPGPVPAKNLAVPVPSMTAASAGDMTVNDKPQAASTGVSEAGNKKATEPTLSGMKPRPDIKKLETTMPALQVTKGHQPNAEVVSPTVQPIGCDQSSSGTFLLASPQTTSTAEVQAQPAEPESRLEAPQTSLQTTASLSSTSQPVVSASVPLQNIGAEGPQSRIVAAPPQPAVVPPVPQATSNNILDRAYLEIDWADPSEPPNFVQLTACETAEDMFLTIDAEKPDSRSRSSVQRITIVHTNPDPGDPGLTRQIRRANAETAFRNMLTRMSTLGDDAQPEFKVTVTAWQDTASS